MSRTITTRSMSAQYDKIVQLCNTLGKGNTPECFSTKDMTMEQFLEIGGRIVTREECKKLKLKFYVVTNTGLIHYKFIFLEEVWPNKVENRMRLTKIAIAPDGWCWKSPYAKMDDIPQNLLRVHPSIL